MKKTLLRILKIFLVICIAGFLLLYLILYTVFNRTHEFRAQARLGQPIVAAIDEYKKYTGNYPASLTSLVPTYLPKMPEIPDKSKYKFGGWDYRLVKKGDEITYELSYYMGKGGIVYEPPNWIGVDEGSRKVILKNK